ncbi:hypothetical protein A0H81_00043 [Grifola frondosa]|uniref:Uncharacterized protein n=1 Tax=Grifola frondosa TaxID=5627 RepID=A0A1C7MPK0_GRIFR|nr:hypothetical protein A0H81_00043 [Grifola frondosa]
MSDEFHLSFLHSAGKFRTEVRIQVIATHQSAAITTTQKAGLAACRGKCAGYNGTGGHKMVG